MSLAPTAFLDGERRPDGPNGGVADSLDAAKAAPGSVGAAPLIGGAPAESRSSARSAFAGKSGREMLNLSLSAHDPGCVKTHTSVKCIIENIILQQRAGRYARSRI
jgi:hypothetical protein